MQHSTQLGQTVTNCHPNKNNTNKVYTLSEQVLSLASLVSNSLEICAGRIDTLRPPFGPLTANALMEIFGGDQSDLVISCSFQFLQGGVPVAFEVSLDPWVKEEIIWH